MPKPEVVAYEYESLLYCHPLCSQPVVYRKECFGADIFGLESHRAKTLGGPLTRLAAKVAAYTCAQRINESLGRPLRHLADLLV